MPFKAGDLVICPHCKQEWSDPVEDCVIPNQVAQDSEVVEDCELCFERCLIGKNADGSFYVDKTS